MGHTVDRIRCSIFSPDDVTHSSVILINKSIIKIYLIKICRNKLYFLFCSNAHHDINTTFNKNIVLNNLLIIIIQVHSHYAPFCHSKHAPILSQQTCPHSITANMPPFYHSKHAPILLLSQQTCPHSITANMPPFYHSKHAPILSQQTCPYSPFYHSNMPPFYHSKHAQLNCFVE